MPGKRSTSGSAPGKTTTPAERRAVVRRAGASDPFTNPYAQSPASRKLRAAGRKAAEQQRRIDERKKAQAKRAAKMRLELEKRVASGKMSNREAREKLQRAGLLPGGSAAKALKGPGGFAAKVIGNVAEDALYTPAGLYEVGKASALDTRDFVRHGDVTPERFGKVAKDTVVSTKDTLRHPLRRPGTTLLVGVGAAAAGAGAVSRVAAAGSAARQASGLGAARAALTRAPSEGGSLLRKAAPGLRYRTTDSGAKIRLGRYSSSPLIRGGQKTIDKARGGKPGVTEAGRARKLGTELAQERKVIDAVERAPAGALARAGKKLTTPQQMALRLWAEETPVSKQLAQHERNYYAARRRGKKSRSNRAAHREEANAIAYRMGLIQAATKYLDEGPDGVPVLKTDFKKPHRHNAGVNIGRKGASPKLMSEIASRIEKVAGDTPGGRERVLKELGLLTDEQIGSRKAAPRRIVEGAVWRPQTKANRMARERVRQGKAEAIRAERAGKREMREAYRTSMLAKGEKAKAEREHFRLATGRSAEEKALLAMRKQLARQADEAGKAPELPLSTKVETREVPRTKDEVVSRIDELDTTLEKYARPFASAFRKKRAEGMPDRKDKHDYWVQKYGKKEGSRIASMPDEDRIAEGYRIGGDRNPSSGMRQANPLEVAQDIIERAVRGDDGPDEQLVRRVLEQAGHKLDDVRAMFDERDQLRKLVDENQDPEVVFGDKPAPGWGTKTEAQTIEQLAELDPETHAKVIRDLHDTQEALREAEAAREALVAQAKGKMLAYDEMAQDAEVRRWVASQRTGEEPKAIRDRAALEADELRKTGDSLVGAEQYAGSGKVRIPDVPEVRRPQPTGIATWRGGVARKPPSTTNAYTGRLRRKGNYRVKTSELVSQSGLEAQRYASVERTRKRVLEVARDTRPADSKLVHWQPVRVTSNLSRKDRALLQDIGKRAEDNLEVTPEERRLAQSLYDQLTGRAFPTIEELERDRGATIGVGQEVPGVKWVPAKVLRDVNKHVASGAPHPLVTAWDTVSSLIKTGIIVAKPAYVVANTVGNLAFNLVQQGLMLPANWRTAARLAKDTDVITGIDGVMGNGAMSAFLDGPGKLSGAVHAATDRLSVVTDLMFRRSAFVHEARRFGFKTAQDYRRLLEDPELRDQLVEIGNRAKAEIVDYDRMGPIERDFVRRVVFIYPWVKGATMYAGNFLLEHPVQAGVYSQIAQVGREEARRDLGPVPAYAKGTFKVGGSEDYPLTVNPANVSPWSQAAEVADTLSSSLVTGKGGPSEALGGMLAPHVQALIAGATRRDLYTGRELHGTVQQIAGKAVASSFAPVNLAKQLDRAKSNETQASERTFPMTARQAKARFFLGSYMPRTANRKKLNETALSDARATLSPTRKATLKVYDERKALFNAFKERDPQALENGKLPAKIRTAYNREAKVSAERARIDDQYPPGIMRERLKLVAEAQLAEEWGLLAKGTANELAARATETKSTRELRRWRDRLRYNALGPAYGDITSRARKYLDQSPK